MLQMPTFEFQVPRLFDWYLIFFSLFLFDWYLQQQNSRTWHFNRGVFYVLHVSITSQIELCFIDNRGDV